MISNKYTKTFTVKRNVWHTESGYDYSVLTTAGTFKGHLQQADAQMVQNLALNFSTAYICWCDPATDIKLGDVLVLDGKAYDVRLIQDNSFVGINKHLEVTLEKQQDYES